MEPNAVHEVARSLEMFEIWFDEIIPLRLPEKLGSQLRSLSIQSGYLGDLNTHRCMPYDEEKAEDEPTAWLPTKKVARAWQAVMNGKRL